MISNVAIIIVMSLTLGGVIALLLMFRTLRKQMLEMTLYLVGIGEIVKTQLDSFKLLADMDAKNKEVLQRIINRQEYHIALSKYILAGARLDFIGHKCACVEHEDYENATQLEKTIHIIEELLSTE